MKNMKKNILFSTFYQLFTMIIPLVTSPYLSRVLGAKNIGIYAESNSLAYYFFIFAMLGVNNYGNREISKNKDDKKLLTESFWQIYYMQFFLSFIFVFIYILIVLFLIKRNTIIYAIQIICIFSALFDINWFAFGLEEFKLTTIRSITIKFITTVCLFLFVRSSNDLIFYTLIMTVGNIVSLLMIWPLVIKKVGFQLPNTRIIIKHIKPNLKLFLPLVASSVYQYMDKIMLGYFINSEEVGYYNYAENITSIVMSVMLGVNTVLLPRVSHTVAKNEYHTSSNILRISLKYTSILNVALMFGLIGISSRFIPWYLGDGYIRSSEIATILAFNIFICGISNIVRTCYIIPYSKDSIYIVSIMFGALLNIVCNLILMPFLGGVGAAIATVVSYLFVLIYQTVKTINEVPYFRYLKHILFFIPLGISMLLIIFIIMYFIKNQIVSIGLSIIIGGLYYLTITVLFLYFTKDQYITSYISRITKH